MVMHTRDTIRDRHLQWTNDFNKLIAGLSEDEYTGQPGGKWSAAQHLEHLNKVNKMILLALRLPVFVLRLMYGRNTVKSRTEAELWDLYQPFSIQGVTAPSAYVPSAKPLKSKTELLEEHIRINSRLADWIMRRTESDLDGCRVHHPIWKKIPVRELLIFNVFHNEHHLKNLLKQLKA